MAEGPRIGIRAGTAALALVLLVACSSSGGSPAAVGRTTTTPTPTTTYPDAIAVLGHSGATGFDSDPARPGTDAEQNSWATGENPEVDSVYLRLLALNPAARGHAVNVAVDGSGVDDLAGQAEQALAARPVPDLFLIQTVDNDIRCDGTDDVNYARFGTALAAVLRQITSAAPRARILVVSSPWATAENYAAVAATLPGPRAASSGTGPCDLLDPAGQPVPAHERTLTTITEHYFDQLRSACTRFRACRYDDGALAHMTITADDITPTDGDHLTVAGLRKQAALEWQTLGFA